MLHTLAKGYTVQTYHPDGTPANEIPLYNDTYHWRVCIGSAHSLIFDDDINVFEKTEHSKVPLIVTAATTSSKAVVKDVCSICGWARPRNTRWATSCPSAPAPAVWTARQALTENTDG